LRLSRFEAGDGLSAGVEQLEAPILDAPAPHSLERRT
jgi:hypothetical protein